MRGQVATAINRGLLAKLDGSVKCVDCGKPARVYDHRDYAHPLDVDPVCKRCNQKRGPASNYLSDSIVHATITEPIAKNISLLANSEKRSKSAMIRILLEEALDLRERKSTSTP